MKKKAIAPTDTGDIKSRMLVLRKQAVLLDRDVATLYGVQTREINQTVRNNPDKFLLNYFLQLDKNEFSDWNSKVLISITSAGHKLADLIGENLSTQTVEPEIELNLAVVKIRHKITKVRKA